MLALRLAATCLALPLTAVAEVPGGLLSLDGSDWTVKNAAGSLSAPARVPGTVPEALFEAGLRPDPAFGQQQLDVLKEMVTENFTYTRTFKTPPACAAAGQTVCELVFDGVDTAAEVLVNGVVVGRTENMHQRYVFDLRSAMRTEEDAENRLEVRITSAILYARRVAAAHGDPTCEQVNRGHWGVDGLECSSYIRKNTGAFGWDCARPFVTQGIWKSVWLRIIEKSVVDEVVPVITGKLDAANTASNEFAVEARVYLRSAGTQMSKLTVSGSWSKEATVKKQVQLSGDSADAEYVSITLKAKDVELWWPSGEGKQAMYNLTTSVDDGPAVVQRIGFRTFELVGSVGNNTEKHFNASLWFKVNGRPVYSKGQNWMPGDVLTADNEWDRQNKRQRLLDVVRVFGNTIRVWGGGIYETKAFYDAADELGLMVMQDGSFFSNVYPHFQKFYDLVRQEVAYNAHRIASHPSLIMYSGNNEGDVFGDVHLYVEEQLATVQAENPNVAIYPSNPSNGWDSLKPLVPRANDPSSPKWRRPFANCEGKICPHDDHYYGPCGTIPKDVQFGSEFGWPSADIYTVNAKVTPEGADKLQPGRGSNAFLDYRSTVVNELWQVESMLYANSTMVATFPTLLSEEDATPEGLERWLYLTQALQMYCAGRSIEAYRQRSEVMGTLVWAVNSIWIAPAWGSVSHDGSWKMLQYHFMHTFAPVLLSFVYHVEPNNYTKLPQPSVCEKGYVCLHISNHMQSALAAGLCSLEVRDFHTGKVRFKEDTEAPEVPAVSGKDLMSSEVAPVLQKANCRDGECFFTARCGGDVVAQPYYPTPLAKSSLKPATITAEVADFKADAVTMTIQSDTTTPYVFLSSTIPGRFSKNAFTLLPGEELTLHFDADVKLSSKEDWEAALRIYSMNNKQPTKLVSSSTGVWV